MKKFASLILALAMMFTLCINVGAADVNLDSAVIGGAPDASASWIGSNPVSVKVTTGIEGGVRYYVTINWNDMDFTYKRSAEGNWNVDTHKYDEGNDAGWLVDGNIVNEATATFTVENHSNAQVTVTALMNGTSAKASENLGVSMKISDSDKTLESADQLPYLGTSNCDKTEYTLTVSGEPTEVYDWGSDYVAIDSIAVVIGTP